MSARQVPFEVEVASVMKMRIRFFQPVIAILRMRQTRLRIVSVNEVFRSGEQVAVASHTLSRRRSRLCSGGCSSGAARPADRPQKSYEQTSFIEKRPRGEDHSISAFYNSSRNLNVP